MDKFRDRGNIKWTSMMLTEHREALKAWGESQNDIAPPNKTEDELAELAEQIGRAIASHCEVRLTYYRDKRNHEAVGIITRFNPAIQAVYLESASGPVIIPVNDLVHCSLT
ncbi:YolD-like family protein [Aneurinibacillus sp. Ricciae_BoGa-3]|uniref:YolD-like family protein n=1 Tax=Aneurinibacillus sp. Ricciae_BoGa-3 TaxID=3022697 RepID=UPI0023416D3C|nr:YolD-like family protein [Aneurinibacillus sp. Ricciae_BoGa-3]WCK55869.1 YolD-like family protein [Aneurinibacillus sp. Ricciae_BoGa-3]